MQTRPISPALAVAASLVAAVAHAGWLGTWGNGAKVTEARPVAGFTRVEVHVPLDIVIRAGPAFALSLTTDSNLAPLVETTVSGGTLTISSKESISLSRGKNLVEITMPDFRGLTVHGSSDVTVSGFSGDRDVALTVHGSGDIHYAGSARSVAVAIHGSGNVLLDQGSAGKLAAEIHGSGDLEAGRFELHDASIGVEGSGDAEVTLHGGSLNAAVTGSGDIVWHGDARVASSRSGSGEIVHR